MPQRKIDLIPLSLFARGFGLTGAFCQNETANRFMLHEAGGVNSGFAIGVSCRITRA